MQATQPFSTQTQPYQTDPYTQAQAYTPQPVYPTQEYPQMTTTANDKPPFSPSTRNWFFLALIATIIFAAQVLPATFIKPSVLTVVGEGKVSATPEKMSLIVTKVTSGVDVDKVISEGENGLRSLKETARSIAGGDAEIQESFYQLAPTTANRAGVLVTLYQVANAFQVTTKNVDKSSDLVKSLYLDGATTVSNVSFVPADPLKIEQDARVAAVRDGRKKAEAIARAAGQRLGRLVSISDDNAQAASTVGQAADETQGSALGKIDITKRVSAVYEVW